jgi:hypothetical protein
MVSAGALSSTSAAPFPPGAAWRQWGKEQAVVCGGILLAARGVCKGSAMNPQSEAFQVGEQVTLIQPYMRLGVGSVGTITRIYHTHPACYRVRFEHVDVTVPVPSEYLARVRMYGRI